MNNSHIEHVADDVSYVGDVGELDPQEYQTTVRLLANEEHDLYAGIHRFIDGKSRAIARRMVECMVSFIAGGLFDDTSCKKLASIAKSMLPLTHYPDRYSDKGSEVFGSQKKNLEFKSYALPMFKLLLSE